jgi:hypothetical protein
MNVVRWIRIPAVAAMAMLWAHGTVATQPAAPLASHTNDDGQDDFDFLIGSWKVHLKKLVKPLTGSTTWIEFDGTSSARKILGGRANMDEFSTEDPQTHARTEGITVRLYNPTTKEWHIYWINPRDGVIGLPVVGKFKNGRGEFYDHEEFQGRTIFVRYVWSNITANAAHFEQSFSEDGGTTWETNWITDQTRVTPQS